jgi:hypothetical protein
MTAVNPFVVADILDELKKVFEDKTYRKVMCDAYLRRMGHILLGGGHMWDKGKYANYGWSSSSHISTVFGEYCGSKYTSNIKYAHMLSTWTRQNGIEILGLRPFAKGTTYSQHCQLTIDDLKKACEKNGIKVWTTWKKVQYLHALMKV